MTGKAKIIAVCLITLLALVVAPYTAQALPTAEQIAQIQDNIDICKAAQKDLTAASEQLVKAEFPSAEWDKAMDDAIKALDRMNWHNQLAINLANEYYATNVADATYDRWLQDEAATNPRTGAITIGNGAFDSPGWLASTKIHEQTHRQQVAAGCITSSVAMCTPLRHQLEIAAYQAELDAAGQTGLNETEKKRIQDQIKWHKARLPP
jgi:hypothetical protein